VLHYFRERSDNGDDSLSVVRTPFNSQSQGSSPDRIASRTVSNELKKLLQHSSHYLTGILLSLGLGFVSFPIFTRMFSVTDYGTIDLVAKVLLLLVALSKMGLQQSALRFYDVQLFSTDHSAARRYYSTMFGGMALSATCVTLTFLVIIIGLTSGSFISSSLALLLIPVSSLILMRALTSVLWVFMRVQEKTKLFSVFTVTTKAAVVAVICLLIPWLGRTVRAYYSGTIVVEVVILIILSALLLRGDLLSPRAFDVGLFRTSLAFGLPLIGYELAGITLDAGDRVLVRHYLGGEALGFYSLAYGMSDYANNLLIVPINLALVPIYLRLWTTEGLEKTSEFLSRGLDFFFMGAAGVLAVVAATSHNAVTVFASSKYRGADALIPTLVAGLLIYTSHGFLSAGLMIHKDTFTMAKILAYSAVLNIGLNCVLLPRIGLQGAAFATLVSYLFCVVFLSLSSHKLLPLRIDPLGLGKYVLAAAVAWYAGSRCRFGSPVVELAGQCALSSIVYFGLLCVMDSRVRALPGHLLGLLRPSTNFEKSELAITPRGET
jgi:O-antigen/teichoic acid export membrane protein